jgi:STE24 endopeptidase
MVRLNREVGDENRAERYFTASTRLGFVLALIIGISFGGIVIISTLNPLLGFAVSILFGTMAFLFLVFLGYRIDRKHKGITSSRREYLVAALPVYVIILFFTVIPQAIYIILTQVAGVMIFVYMNAIVVLLLYGSIKLIPSLFRIGSKGLNLEDPKLVERILTLAEKMDIEVEKMFVLSWKKLKIANALQVGPRRFSIYLSDYLIENLTPVQVEAVVAHELAHAKKKHLLKILLLMLPPLLIGMNIFLYFWVNRLYSPSNYIFAIAGVILIFAGNIIVTPIQRKFELEADALSAKILGTPEPIISALYRIGELNLIPRKYPRFIGWGLPHPSIETRIKKIMTIKISDCS